MKLLCLKRLSNGRKLIYDEKHTVLFQTEAIRNSQPNAAISDNAKETVPRTTLMLFNWFVGCC